MNYYQLHNSVLRFQEKCYKISFRLVAINPQDKSFTGELIHHVASIHLEDKDSQLFAFNVCHLGLETAVLDHEASGENVTFRF